MKGFSAFAATQMSADFNAKRIDPLDEIFEQIEATAKSGGYSIQTKAFDSQTASEFKETLKEWGYHVEKKKVQDRDAPCPMAYLVVQWQG